MAKQIETGFADRVGNVLYELMDDGTLYLRGEGSTLSICPGGFDGRQVYEKDPAPWSEAVSKQAVKLVAEEGITGIGSFLLDELPNLEEMELADSVVVLGAGTASNVRILKAGQGFKANYCRFPALEELSVPGEVLYQGCTDWDNVGLSSSVPQTQKLIEEKERAFYCAFVREMFRHTPEVIEPLCRLSKVAPEMQMRYLWKVIGCKADEWLKGIDWNRFVLRPGELKGCGKLSWKGLSPAWELELDWGNTLHRRFGGSGTLPQLVGLAAMVKAVAEIKKGRLTVKNQHIAPATPQGKAVLAWLREEFPAVEFVLA